MWAVFFLRPSSSVMNRRPHWLHWGPRDSKRSGRRYGRCRCNDDVSNAMSRVRVSIMEGGAAGGAAGAAGAWLCCIGSENGSVKAGVGVRPEAETAGGGAAAALLDVAACCVGGSMPVFRRALSSAMGSDGPGVDVDVAGRGPLPGVGDRIAAGTCGCGCGCGLVGGVGVDVVTCWGVAEFRAAIRAASEPAPNRASSEIFGAAPDGGGASTGAAAGAGTGVVVADRGGGTTATG